MAINKGKNKFLELLGKAIKPSPKSSQKSEQKKNEDYNEMQTRPDSFVNDEGK